MDAGDVCIFVAGYCFATEASQKPPVSHGLARGPGTLGHGHARRPDVNFVHEGGREGAAGPVAGHGQGWLGTATALHTRSLVMTDYDYDQCTMYVFCPRARGAGRISRPIPAGGVWTRQRQPQTCQDSFLGKMGHSRGGGGGAPGRWISPIRRAAFPFSFLFSRRTKRKTEGGGFRFQNSLTTNRYNAPAKQRKQRCISHSRAAKAARRLGSADQTPISPRPTPLDACLVSPVCPPGAPY